uniref:CSON011419 protein n=1 Tax=Culicoides sonorensis TaxID=179676 RepID=A0A336M7D6_CULSO
MTKKLLVIGNGGREHAICWKLSKSIKVKQIFALPGSPGISQVSKTSCVEDVKPNDFRAIVQFCKTNSIDLVVVGPEEPLANGLADVLHDANILCFGPCRAGAAIEASKDWAKSFMVRHGIPTAKYRSFTNSNEAKAFIKKKYESRVSNKACSLT